jgi:hypothetical protein
VDALLLRCPPRTAPVFRKVLTSARPLSDAVEALLGCHMCGNYTRAIMLESCEDVVCSRCFEDGTLATPSHHRFPIKCLRPACESLVSLTELRKLVSPGRLRALFDESVKQYTELRSEMYSRCRNGYCDSVRPSLNTAEIFTCPGCLAQTCAFKDCGKVPHPGWNCQARWVWLTYTSAFLYGDVC